MDQPDTASGQGILRTVDTDGLVYVRTSFEPDEARRLWACFDQPDLEGAARVHRPRAGVLDGHQLPEPRLDRRGRGGRPHVAVPGLPRRCRRTSWS